MDYRGTECIDLSDPKELHRYEGRLYMRLQRLGFHLAKGEVKSTSNKKQLKRVPKKRGYQITDIASGSIVLGRGYNLSLEEVEGFWREKDKERRDAVRQEEAKRRREETKKAGKSPFSWW